MSSSSTLYKHDSFTYIDGLPTLSTPVTGSIPDIVFKPKKIQRNALNTPPGGKEHSQTESRLNEVWQNK